MVPAFLLMFFEAQVNLLNTLCLSSTSCHHQLKDNSFVDPSISGGRMGRPHGEEEPASCVQPTKMARGSKVGWKVDQLLIKSPTLNLTSSYKCGMQNNKTCRVHAESFKRKMCDPKQIPLTRWSLQEIPNLRSMLRHEPQNFQSFWWTWESIDTWTSNFLGSPNSLRNLWWK